MISMETDPDSIRSEIYVDASPETVFRALTDPAELAQWWGSDATYRCTDWSVDLRPGGAQRSEGKNVSDHRGGWPSVAGWLTDWAESRPRGPSRAAEASSS